jgi:hypothetical protein
VPEGDDKLMESSVIADFGRRFLQCSLFVFNHELSRIELCGDAACPDFQSQMCDSILRILLRRLPFLLLLLILWCERAKALR